jgi:glycosyltransferase involved in cell wall biosynthesis
MIVCKEAKSIFILWAENVKIVKVFVQASDNDATIIAIDGLRFENNFDNIANPLYGMVAYSPIYNFVTPDYLPVLKEENSKNLVEIQFEKEITALYKSFDIIVHVPISAAFEAFGQVYIEAMAASVPGIFTLSGIAEEYIINNKNAVVVDYKNAEQIYTGILNYLNNNSFKQQIVTEAKKDVHAIFGIDKMVNSLNSLYLNGSV